MISNLFRQEELDDEDVGDKEMMMMMMTADVMEFVMGAKLPKEVFIE